MLQKLVKV